MDLFNKALNKSTSRYPLVYPIDRINIIKS